MFETTGVIARNERLGADGFWMEIECPEVAAASLPGQFAMILAADGPEPLTGRPFSLADVRGGRIVFAYIVVGKVTALMAEMAPGRRVPVLGPLGKPFDYRSGATRHVMVAGGIGSAPFPLLARALREVAPEEERIVLLGGRTRDHLYASEVFEELGCELRLATDDGSAGHHGLVTDLADPYVDDSTAKLYACGPTPMFLSLAAKVAGKSIPCEISVEPVMACGFGACYGCVVPRREGDGFTYVKSCQEGPTFDLRELRLELLQGH